MRLRFNLLTTATKAPPRLALGNFVRFAVGGILIAAAILKCYGAWHGDAPEIPLLRSIWAQVALVQVELILGTWLISGIAPRFSHIAAILAFSCFLAAASYQVVQQARSCGCFGPVRLDPRITVGLDAAVLIALLSCWRACRIEPGIPRVARRFIVVAGCVAAVAAPVFILRSGDPFDGRRIVFLEPAQWPGTAFPLLRYINDGDALRRGNWLVMLYRHDCPTCEAAMPAYLDLAKRVSAQGKARGRIAFVEIPPVGQNETHAPDAFWFTLADNKEWAGATPIVVLLRDGIVQAAIEGESALKPPANAEQWIQ